ncbi:MAG: carboxypeptidase regulatory-like domain-containing protein [Micromonosporaceae bacterium]|nr:carboxypeptidase regulatory-like domain-containing protein [Micromonosporaceae bacterium]
MDAVPLGEDDVKVTVMDSSGVPLEGAAVSIRPSPDFGGLHIRQQETNQDGAAVFYYGQELDGLAHHGYLIEVSYAGFQSFSADVQALSSEPTEVVVSLKPEGTNTAPVIVDVQSVSEQEYETTGLLIGQRVKLTVDATDPDGDDLFYLWESDPDVAFEFGVYPYYGTTTTVSRWVKSGRLTTGTVTLTVTDGFDPLVQTLRFQ